MNHRARIVSNRILVTGPRFLAAGLYIRSVSKPRSGERLCRRCAAHLTPAPITRPFGRVARQGFKMVCERPPHEGETYAGNVRALFSPSARGRAAEGGRGALTHHLELSTIPVS